MREIRTFEVTQTRRVIVQTAGNHLDAAKAADLAFRNQSTDSLHKSQELTTVGEVEEINLVIWDERFNNAPTTE